MIHEFKDPGTGDRHLINLRNVVRIVFSQGSATAGVFLVGSQGPIQVPRGEAEKMAEAMKKLT